MSLKNIHVLLVEDNLGDVRLTREAFRGTRLNVELDVVRDGQEALEFLRNEGKFANAVRPDLILLDLNLPRKDGKEVLESVKFDDKLRTIPIIVLTTSSANEDVLGSYRLYANGFIVKPADFDYFKHIIAAIENFWFNIVSLPPA